MPVPFLIPGARLVLALALTFAACPAQRESLAVNDPPLGGYQFPLVAYADYGVVLQHWGFLNIRALEFHLVASSGADLTEVSIWTFDPVTWWCDSEVRGIHRRVMRVVRKALRRRDIR
ncbi:MAG: hypothetical protein IPM29_23965 [Planctomycetes bacterium]|nr:hypothetical protein [Planctomycetota bacterium]